jgi:ureidoglycolate amidohydrolase
VVDAAADAANRLGLSSKRMVSRAYHDSLFMAEVAPTAMLFIPCFKGYSHRHDQSHSTSASTLTSTDAPLP